LWEFDLHAALVRDYSWEVLEKIIQDAPITYDSIIAIINEIL
jgi:hypothetical protein